MSDEREYTLYGNVHEMLNVSERLSVGHQGIEDCIRINDVITKGYTWYFYCMHTRGVQNLK